MADEGEIVFQFLGEFVDECPLPPGVMFSEGEVVRPSIIFSFVDQWGTAELPARQELDGQNGGVHVPNSSGGRSVEDILMPGGKPLGVRGTGPRADPKIRELPGEAPEAERLFRELTVGGTDVTPPGYQGKLIRLPGSTDTVG